MELAKCIFYNNTNITSSENEHLGRITRDPRYSFHLNIFSKTVSNFILQKFPSGVCDRFKSTYVSNTITFNFAMLKMSETS